jgi:two-component system, cell cycle sensor histidine kinase and response regulator CckA
MPRAADLTFVPPTVLSSLGQLASLLRTASEAAHVHVTLELPSEKSAIAVEIDRDGQRAVQPTLQACDGELLLGDEEIVCIDDLEAFPVECAKMSGRPDVMALAVARVRSTLGEPVGHVMLADMAPRVWTAQDRRVLEHGAGLAQAIADARAQSVSEQRLRDMTASLEESQVRLERIIGSAMDAIISIDADRRIMIFNAAAERIFRVTAIEAIGTLIDRFLPTALRDGHARLVSQFAASGTTTRSMGRATPLRGQRADGEVFPIEATISRTDINGRTLLTVILRDVTEREKLEAQFRQSQKMEAMGRLAGGVAHDFNNLLTVIRGGADFLLGELPPQGDLRRDAEEILAAADRAAGLTRQLLAFGRKQVLQPEVLDLNGVITNVERLLHRVIGEDIALRVTLEPAPLRVLADAGQLEQVLVNLAVNARDAMPSGGTLMLTTDVREGGNLPSSMPHWPGATPDQAVLFSMSDSGAGMDQSVLARAFEPFFTTKEPGRGTGLGLATVYGIIEQSGGLLAIESTPGQGTTIWVALPLTEEAGTAERTMSSPSATAAGHGTILLVEDDDGVRAIVHRVLTRAGYRLIEARNAVEGHFLWRRHDGPGGGIDLVVTDMIMPGSTGRELATRLREERERTPVLFTSGYLEGGMAGDDDPTITAYLEKPFTSRRLLDEVRQLLVRDR